MNLMSKNALRRMKICVLINVLSRDCLFSEQLPYHNKLTTPFTPLIMITAWWSHAAIFLIILHSSRKLFYSYGHKQTFFLATFQQTLLKKKILINLPLFKNTKNYYFMKMVSKFEEYFKPTYILTDLIIYIYTYIL